MSITINLLKIIVLIGGGCLWQVREFLVSKETVVLRRWER